MWPEGARFIDIPPANLAVKEAVFSMRTCGLCKILSHLLVVADVSEYLAMASSGGTSTRRSGLEVMVVVEWSKEDGRRAQYQCDGGVHDDCMIEKRYIALNTTKKGEVGS